MPSSDALNLLWNFWCGLKIEGREEGSGRAGKVVICSLSYVHLQVFTKFTGSSENYFGGVLLTKYHLNHCLYILSGTTSIPSPTLCCRSVEALFYKQKKKKIGVRLDSIGHYHLYSTNLRHWIRISEQYEHFFFNTDVAPVHTTGRPVMFAWYSGFLLLQQIVYFKVVLINYFLKYFFPSDCNIVWSLLPPSVGWINNRFFITASSCEIIAWWEEFCQDTKQNSVTTSILRDSNVGRGDLWDYAETASLRPHQVWVVWNNETMLWPTSTGRDKAENKRAEPSLRVKTQKSRK